MYSCFYQIFGDCSKYHHDGCIDLKYQYKDHCTMNLELSQTVLQSSKTASITDKYYLTEGGHNFTQSKETARQMTMRLLVFGNYGVSGL